jgi:hypothetical protein
MQTPDRKALRDQEIAQHAAARERELKMEFIYPPHDGQISR